MFKDLSMRIFLAHLVAFVVITAGLTAVNLWLTPQHIWFVWMLMGWGVVVATHDLALLLLGTRRRERIFIDRKARAFAVHLFAYVAVILLLLLVNLTVTPKAWWFYWVALGWGIGVLVQGWCVFVKHRRNPPQHSSRQESAPAPKSKSQPAKKARGRAPAKRR
jgi:hypothetical protein